MSDRIFRPTLVAALWPVDASRSRLLRDVVLVVLGSLIMAVSAKIQVPFWPVPMTMQTYAVLLIGMAYGLRLASATMLLYLLEGAVGLPVFAGAATGLVYFAGPTGGYLIGFLLAAAACGWLAERGWDRDLPRLLAALLIGTIIPFATGLPWLAVVIGDMDKAIAAGLTPFLLGAAVKLALAAATLPLAWNLIGRFKRI